MGAGVPMAYDKWTGFAPNGDQTLDTTQALDRFFASVERRALRMAQIATGDTEEALDIVQDAMLGLVQRYAHKPEAEWPPIFYRILQSRVYDWHRRQKVRRRWRVWLDKFQHHDDEREDPLHNLAHPDQRGPGEQTAGDDALGELAQAIGALPLRQQQAFMLRAWEGMDVAETAYAMGCSQGSVKTHYSRAVHTLRKQLGEPDDD